MREKIRRCVDEIRKELEEERQTGKDKEWT